MYLFYNSKKWLPCLLLSLPSKSSARAPVSGSRWLSLMKDTGRTWGSFFLCPGLTLYHLDFPGTSPLDMVPSPDVPFILTFYCFGGVPLHPSMYPHAGHCPPNDKFIPNFVSWCWLCLFLHPLPGSLVNLNGHFLSLSSSSLISTVFMGQNQGVGCFPGYLDSAQTHWVQCAREPQQGLDRKPAPRPGAESMLKNYNVDYWKLHCCPKPCPHTALASPVDMEVA